MHKILLTRMSIHKTVLQILAWLVLSLPLKYYLSVSLTFCFPYWFRKEIWHLFTSGFLVLHKAFYLVAFTFFLAAPSFSTYLPVFLLFFSAPSVSDLGCRHCASLFWWYSSWVRYCLKLAPQRGWPVHHFGEDSQVDSVRPFWLTRLQALW